MKSLAGAREIDIVYSGLEEIMCHATLDHWNYAVEKNINFRDACFGKSISKIYDHFKQTGLMI
jgi:glutamate dehydrogenase/leucine dehydrogenase